ncbi:MAG: DNA translocase FtsK 4TM domain-containing protein [Eubacteriales bacterium]|nr:DNA translocase FtsK 4TM domain-containing protein [Eubacteriales bacterium]
MAGSNNQNKKSSSNNRKSNNQNKKVAENNKKTNQTVEQEVSYTPEIMVWVVAAIMLIIELGNFGLCGFINYISQFLFGIFGIIEYVLPLVVAFAAFFLHVNEYKKRAVHKVIFGSCVLVCIGMLGQLVTGMEQFSIINVYNDGYDNKMGGGVICGSIAYLLHKGVGSVGTYIIILLVLILCIVLFAEVSVIEWIKSFLADDEDYEEEDEFEEERRKTTKKRTKQSRDIVVEDFPNYHEKSDTPKRSMLESISVLPADTDKGILPSKKVDKLPEHEEVHEIKMDYVFNLPGENMDAFDVSEVPKEEVKTEQKKRSRNKNDIPKVIPVESMEIKQSEKIEEPKNSVVPEDIQKMENKTAPEVKVASAKVAATSESGYQFPPIDLLKKGKAASATKEESIQQNALKLQEVLKSFGVNVTMTNYSCGPSVTRYEMVPEQGVKVSKITGLADDIMMNLAAQSIRIEAPIPGKSAVGIEIPNGTRTGVGFRELIDTEKFIKHPSKIAFACGKDIEGNVVVEDIAKMPHLLIAGATGSGKSVCTNTLIMSILYKAQPDEVKLILIDPKQVELKVYNGIPHLLTPVVTDPKKAAGALNWAVAEMTKRYQIFSEFNVRNIQGYNTKVKEMQESGKIPEEEQTLEKMPQIVIIVDELADLMMVAKSEVEEAIVRLAQLARAAGIHLVIATQRPSVDVVTGLIKANVPSRIALSVSSGIDSRTIIDTVGAEKLLGNGDMLFYPTMYPQPLRVQGAYISDEEVLKVVDFLKEQNENITYSEELTNQITSAGTNTGATQIGSGSENDRDEYFVQAGKFIIDKNKASIGMLQRMFKIGFNRAARIMDQLCEAGVVGPEEGTKPRQVLMSEEQFDEYIDEYF